MENSMMDMSDVSIDTRRSWNNSRSLDGDGCFDDRSTSSGVSDLAKVAIEAAKEGIFVTLGVNADGMPTLTLGTSTHSGSSSAVAFPSGPRVPTRTHTIKSCMKDASARSHDDTCTTTSDSVSSRNLDVSHSTSDKNVQQRRRKRQQQQQQQHQQLSPTIPTTLTVKRTVSGNLARHQRSLPVVVESQDNHSSTSTISDSGTEVRTSRGGRRPRRSHSRRLSDLTNGEEEHNDRSKTDGLPSEKVQPTPTTSRRRSRSRTKVSSDTKTRRGRSKSGTRGASGATARSKSYQTGSNDLQSSQTSMERSDSTFRESEKKPRRRSSIQSRISRCSDDEDQHCRSGRRRSRSTSNQSRVKDMNEGNHAADAENYNHNRPRRSRSTSNQSRVRDMNDDTTETNNLERPRRRNSVSLSSSCHAQRKEMGVAKDNERRRRRSSSQSRLVAASSNSNPKERRRRSSSVQHRLVECATEEGRRKSSVPQERNVASDTSDNNRRSSAPGAPNDIEMSFLKSLEKKPAMPKLIPFEVKRVVIDESKNTEAMDQPRDDYGTALDRRARRHSNRLRHSRRLLAAAAAAVEKSQLQQVLLENNPDEAREVEPNKRKSKKGGKVPDYLPDFDWASHRNNLEVNPEGIDQGASLDEKGPRQSESEIEKVKNRINSGSSAGKDLIRRMIRSTQKLVRGSDEENGGKYAVTGVGGTRSK